MLNSILIDKIAEFRRLDEPLGYGTIAMRLGIPSKQVRYWCKKLKLAGVRGKLLPLRQPRCKWCNEIFDWHKRYKAFVATGMYCSDECKARLDKETGLRACRTCYTPKPLSEYSHGHQCKECASQASNKRSKSFKKQCLICEKHFVGNRKQKCCSQKCSGMALGKQRKREAIQEISQGTKKCRRCNETKSLDQFCKVSSNAAGYNPYCRSCKTKERQKYYSNSEKRERRNQRKREKQLTPEQKAKLQKYRNEVFNPKRNKKLKEDLGFALNERMRHGINNSLRHNKSKNGSHWEELVPYTIAKLTKHLKKTIPDGYSWQDFLNSELEIDHIDPVTAFNFNAPKDFDFQRCWRLSNLRLLPKIKNRQKSDKLIRGFQISLGL